MTVEGSVKAIGIVTILASVYGFILCFLSYIFGQFRGNYLENLIKFGVFFFPICALILGMGIMQAYHWAYVGSITYWIITIVVLSVICYFMQYVGPMFLGAPIVCSFIFLAYFLKKDVRHYFS